MNLYKYKEILQNINIVVIFSIPIISLILYTLNQRKIMLLQVMIYIGEIFIYLYLKEESSLSINRKNPNEPIVFYMLGLKDPVTVLAMITYYFKKHNY